MIGIWIEMGHVRVLDGSLRLQSSITSKTHLGQKEPEAVRPKLPWPESTARLGLADEPPEGSLQPGLQQDDAGMLGGAGILGSAGVGWICCGRRIGSLIAEERPC